MCGFAPHQSLPCVKGGGTALAVTEGLLCRESIVSSWSHLQSSCEDGNVEKDTERTTFLEGYGLTVIRIPNNEVGRNFQGVCEYIDAAVKQSLSQLR